MFQIHKPSPVFKQLFIISLTFNDSFLMLLLEDQSRLPTRHQDESHQLANSLFHKLYTDHNNQPA